MGLFDDAEVIHTYTRAQAIEDGVFVDLGVGDFAQLVKDAGFKHPVAVTAEVFASCIDLTPAAKRACNDIKGRAWDVLYMLSRAIRAAGDKTEILFGVWVVRDRVRPTLTQLKAVCGPGDRGEPVITIMFPEQD